MYEGWNLTVEEWLNMDNRVEHVGRVLKNLSKLLNSNESLRMDQSFTLSLVVVRAPSYGGGKKRKLASVGEVSASNLVKERRCIIEIFPNGNKNTCCIEALWVAYERATMSRRAFSNKYTPSHRKSHTFHTRCEGLQQTIGIPIGTLCGPNELERFAQYFQR